MKKVPKYGALACPPKNEPEKTILRVTKDGKGYCAAPTVESMLFVSQLKQQEQDKEKSEFWQDPDLSDLVGPYYTNPAQLKMLSGLIGKDETQAMRFITVAAKSGKYGNLFCPNKLHPDWTETYINPITGKHGCRAPSKPRIVTSGESKLCPEVGGDPLALERYIDYYGNVLCRRPVFSGHISCPPPDAPDKKIHITTPSGEGICVTENDILRPFNMNLILPYTINQKTKELLEKLNIHYDDIQIKHLITMNKLINSFSDPISLRTKIQSDTMMSDLLFPFAETIQSRDDFHMANVALRLFMTSKFPNLPKWNINQWSEWFGYEK
jgi:hypothetical protein